MEKLHLTEFTLLLQEYVKSYHTDFIENNVKIPEDWPLNMTEEEWFSDFLSYLEMKGVTL